MDTAGGGGWSLVDCKHNYHLLGDIYTLYYIYPRSLQLLLSSLPFTYAQIRKMENVKVENMTRYQYLNHVKL